MAHGMHRWGGILEKLFCIIVCISDGVLLGFQRKYRSFLKFVVLSALAILFIY